MFEMAGGPTDLRGLEALTFRAAQTTRDVLTNAVQDDLTFSVRLWDAAGVESTIHIGAYGGGIEQPYQRTGCGGGAGWANEFETIRVPLSGFLVNQSGLDLRSIVAVEFLFGPLYGSPEGRICLDEIEFIRR